MVKQNNTRRIFLPLIKFLLDISKIIYFSLVSQFLKYWYWQSVVNNFTRLSLECIFEHLSHHFVEDHVWKRLLVKYILSYLLWLYPIFNWAIYHFRIWWLEYPFQKKITYFITLIDHDSNKAHSRLNLWINIISAWFEEVTIFFEFSRYCWLSICKY